MDVRVGLRVRVKVDAGVHAKVGSNVSSTLGLLLVGVISIWQHHRLGRSIAGLPAVIVWERYGKEEEIST